jgi:molybdopterin-guanine dinucleotide biosynthesis protein A
VGGVSLLIMAGGRGSRLGGTVKAMVRVGGRTILERILDQLGPLADDRLALVHDEALAAPPGLRMVVDTREYAGPLPAMAHALPGATGDVCILVAGDMPFVSRDVFQYLLQLQARDAARVVVPLVDGHIESMHAVFRRQDLREALETAEREGEQRLFKVFESLDPRIVDEAELRSLDPELHTLFNVNSAEDLALAEKLAAAEC